MKRDSGPSIAPYRRLSNDSYIISGYVTRHLKGWSYAVRSRKPISHLKRNGTWCLVTSELLPVRFWGLIWLCVQ